MYTAFVLSGNSSYWFQSVFKGGVTLPAPKWYKPNLLCLPQGEVPFSLRPWIGFCLGWNATSHSQYGISLFWSHRKVCTVQNVLNPWVSEPAQAATASIKLDQVVLRSPSQVRPTFLRVWETGVHLFPHDLSYHSVLLWRLPTLESCTRTWPPQ